MRRVLINSGTWTGIWLGVCFATASAQAWQSQRPREHVFLPPAFGGTPASFQLQAVAQYLAAQGDLAESVAIARKIHAEAVALEIQNWVDAVDAYWERKRIWRDAKNEIRPPYIEREAKRKAIIERRIKEQYQDVARGDVTKHLNWLLSELFGPMAFQVFGGYQSPGDWPVDDTLKRKLESALGQPLKREDLHLIRFKAGKLEFPADEPKVLADPWPPGLRGPEFQSARTAFEKARDDVLAELKTQREVGHENSEKLLAAVNDLLVTLDKVYTPQDRENASISLTYHEARRHLLSLLLVQVPRLIRTQDRSVFDGTLCFQGGTILDLLQHMYQTGLLFAPPEPGGERVYTGILMNNMRNIYLALGSEEPSP